MDDYCERLGSTAERAFGRARLLCSDRIWRGLLPAPVLIVALLALIMFQQAVRAGTDAQAVPPAGPATPSPAATTDVELVFWNSVKDSDDAAMLQTYLDRYPSGVFAPIAKLKLEQLNAQTPLTPAPLPDEPEISNADPYGRQQLLRVTLGGSGTRGVLGLRGQTLEAHWQIAIGPEAKGAIVLNVVPGGAADQIRLRPGDIITRIEGRDVAAMADVARLVGQAGAGKQVSVQIWRPDGDYGRLVRRLIDRAQQDDVPAALALADVYRLGLSGREDRQEAVKWLRKAAETGSTAAMFALGTTLSSSNGSEKEKDLAEALRWLRKASESGDARAMTSLGGMYVNGLGTAKDDAEAVRWFRKASDAGNVDAMSELAQMQLDGRGTPKNDATAVALLRKAADAGNTTAMTRLGIAYATGRGVAKDEAEAVRWYRRAADAGYTEAIYRLGLAYNAGRGVAKDDAEALAILRRAADGGLAAAMTNVGDMYLNGFGTTKDEAEALRWYRQAADADYAPAMGQLGLMYANGSGFPKDDAEATRWYRKAADKGDAASMYTLAIRTEFAMGAARDTEEAARLALASVKGGYEYARTQLINEAEKWSIDFRRVLQRKLKEAGFYDGDIDGRMGGRVKDALDRLAKSGS